VPDLIGIPAETGPVADLVVGAVFRAAQGSFRRRHVFARSTED